jgi:hypothetical protein
MVLAAIAEETKEVSSMRLFGFVAFAALVTTGLQIRAQSLPETIITAEKAVPVVHQTLSGTWLSETRLASPTGLQPPTPTVVTFSSDGTYLVSTSNGTQTAVHGLWIRVGDRKFLGTAYYFSFNESRVLTTITKLRTNFQLSSDGKNAHRHYRSGAVEARRRHDRHVPRLDVLNDPALPGNTR